MKRAILSLISALVLAAGLLLPAAAAAGPQLAVSDTAAASQQVKLTGVPSSCQSLQITLNLSADSAEYSYVPDSGLNRNGIYTTYKQAENQVTVYITAKSGVLTSDGTLTLGTLSADDGSLFTVTGFSNLRMVDSAFTEIPGGGDSSGGGGSSGGGDSSGGSSSGGGGSGGGGSSGGSGSGGSGSEGSSSEDGGGSAADPLPFGDVAAGTWYYDAVRYVYELGLMTGTDGAHFSPDVTTNRAMMVTILYRLEGSPAVSGAAAFPDVAAGQWYADAVAWASANGIVTGYDNGRFGPEDTITREQMAAIFWRYANYKGYVKDSGGTLDGYTDAALVSPYAAEAMAWAIDTGLMTGTSQTTLSPSGFATRAQAAVILTRFSQNVTEQ